MTMAILWPQFPYLYVHSSVMAKVGNYQWNKVSSSKRISFFNSGIEWVGAGDAAPHWTVPRMPHGA